MSTATAAPTKTEMYEALRTARAALRAAEAAIKAGNWWAAALHAEEGAGATSVLWADADVRLHVENCEDEDCTHER